MYQRTVNLESHTRILPTTESNLFNQKQLFIGSQILWGNGQAIGSEGVGSSMCQRLPTSPATHSSFFRAHPFSPEYPLPLNLTPLHSPDSSGMQLITLSPFHSWHFRNQDLVSTNRFFSNLWLIFLIEREYRWVYCSLSLTLSEQPTVAAMLAGTVTLGWHAGQLRLSSEGKSNYKSSRVKGSRELCMCFSQRPPGLWAKKLGLLMEPLMTSEPLGTLNFNQSALRKLALMWIYIPFLYSARDQTLGTIHKLDKCFNTVLQSFLHF